MSTAEGWHVSALVLNLFLCSLDPFQTVFEEKDHGVVCLALEVAGAYVSWVDVNLIANDRCIR